MKDVVGVILGGGEGRRLFPLTLIRSKPAVPLGGKYRLVDIPISNCINAGINRIFVLTQYNSESLNRHITQTYRFGLFSQGFVVVLAAEQTPESASWYQGTADAVRQSLHHLLTYAPSHILVLSGDHLYRMDYQELYRSHTETDADVTVCVHPVNRAEGGQFGILRMQESGSITEFHEKPSDPQVLDSCELEVPSGSTKERRILASMGVYLFKTEVLVEVLKRVPKMDFGRDIIPGALDLYNVRGYIFQGYWEDIGTIKSFYEANLKLASPNPNFNFYESAAPIYSHPRFLPASRIQTCHFRSSLVSEGCDIQGSEISESVIGIRSIIRKGSRLSHTLMLGADYYEEDGESKVALGIGEGSLIDMAIIDKNARVGANVVIQNRRELVEFDGDGYYIRDGIVVIPKNAFIADNTVI